jgi:hypothetical protein
LEIGRRFRKRGRHAGRTDDLGRVSRSGNPKDYYPPGGIMGTTPAPPILECRRRDPHGLARIACEELEAFVLAPIVYAHKAQVGGQLLPGAAGPEATTLIDSTLGALREMYRHAGMSYLVLEGGDATEPGL